MMSRFAAPASPPPAVPRAHQVVILDESGLPMEILIIPRATALDTLAFIRSLIDRIGMEQMARMEGKTFGHPLAGSIGASVPGAVSAYPTGRE